MARPNRPPIRRIGRKLRIGPTAATPKIPLRWPCLEDERHRAERCEDTEHVAQDRLDRDDDGTEEDEQQQHAEKDDHREIERQDGRQLRRDVDVERGLTRHVRLEAVLLLPLGGHLVDGIDQLSGGGSIRAGLGHHLDDDEVVVGVGDGLADRRHVGQRMRLTFWK